MKLDRKNGLSEATGSIELVPPESVVERSASEAELNLMFNKSNKIIVENIFVQPFTEIVARKTLEALSADSIDTSKDILRSDPEFKVVTIRITCIPDPECKFTWLRVSTQLGEKASQQPNPIACMLYPQNSFDKTKYHSDTEISSELTVKFAKVGATKSDGKEYEKETFYIKTFGLFGSSPVWDFKATNVHPEIDNDLTLIMITAAPQGANYSAELSVSARVQLQSGLMIPLISKKRADNIAGFRFTI